MVHGKQATKVRRVKTTAKDSDDPMELSCIWISRGKSFDPNRSAQKHGVKIDQSWKAGCKDILGKVISDYGLKVYMGQAPNVDKVKALIRRFVRKNAEFIREMQRKRVKSYVSIMFGLGMRDCVARYVFFDSQFIQLLSSMNIQLELFACICSDNNDSGRSMRSGGSNRKRRPKEVRR